MGQIERYGLYVLVVVIFMILGVAIWGDGDGVPQGPALPDVDRVAERARVSERTRQPRDAAGRDFERRVEALFTPGQNSPVRIAGGGDRRRDAARAEGALEQTVADRVADDRGRVDPVPTVKTYVVRDGDNFSKIAKREFGRASLADEIQALNPGVDPKGLQIGQEIVLPLRAGAGGAPKSRSGASAAGVHVVASGETIEKIAKRFYGNDWAVQMQAIRELNPDVDPRKMQIGTQLKLPPRTDVASR